MTLNKLQKISTIIGVSVTLVGASFAGLYTVLGIDVIKDTVKEHTVDLKDVTKRLTIIETKLDNKHNTYENAGIYSGTNGWYHNIQ